MKYIRNLSNVDDKILSVSPQSRKSLRPFLGIVVLINGRKYCIPLSSPKNKYKVKSQPDFIKIVDNRQKDKNGVPKLLGVLNINNMIPVTEKVLQRINLNIRKTDSVELRQRKGLLVDEISWCRKNADLIVRKTQRIYDLVTQTPDEKPRIVKRCCDFTKLERELDKYVGNYKYFKTDVRGIEQLKSIDSQIEIHNAKEKGYYIVRTIASDAETVAHALNQNIQKNKIQK